MAKTERIKIKLDVDVNNKGLNQTEDKLNDIKSDADKAGNSVEGIGDSAKKAIPGMKKLDDTTETMTSNMKKLGGVVAGVFAVDSIVEYGNQLDDMEARITTISRGQTDLFEEFKNFDGRFLYDIDDAMETMNKLRNFGIKVNREVLTTISDVASSTGEQIGTVADQFAAALRGEEGSLDDYFKKIKTVNGQLFGEYVNDQNQVVTVSLNNMKEIQAAFDEQYAGATEKRLATTAGQYEVLKQKIMTSFAELYTETQPALNEFFKVIETGLSSVNKFLKENKQSISDTATFFKAALGKIADVFKYTFSFIKSVWLTLTEKMEFALEKTANRINVILKQIVLGYQTTVSATLDGMALIAGKDTEAFQTAAKYNAKKKITQIELNNLIKKENDLKFVESDKLKKANADTAEAENNKNKSISERIVILNEISRQEELQLNIAKKHAEATKKKNEDLKISLLTIDELALKEEERIKAEKAAAKAKADAEKAAAKAKKDAEKDLLKLKEEQSKLDDKAKKDKEDQLKIDKERIALALSNYNKAVLGFDKTSADFKGTKKDVEIIKSIKGEDAADDFISQKIGFDEDKYAPEYEQLQKYYDTKLAMADEYNSSDLLLKKIKAEADHEIDKAERQMWSDNVGALSNSFDAMYQATGENSQELLFMSKSFAIAQATISMFQGAAEAMKLGWPLGIGAAAGVMAQGASIISNLNSIQTPRFHDGGYISNGGGDSIRGDEKRAILQTGEGVLSRKGMDALDKLNRGDSSGDNSTPEVYVYNNQENMMADFMKSRSGKKLIKETVG